MLEKEETKEEKISEMLKKIIYEKRNQIDRLLFYRPYLIILLFSACFLNYDLMPEIFFFFLPVMAFDAMKIIRDNPFIRFVKETVDIEERIILKQILEKMSLTAKHEYLKKLISEARCQLN